MKGALIDRSNVARALKQYDIRYANAQDNDSATWDLVRYHGHGEFHLNSGSYTVWDRRTLELLAE